MNKTLIAVSAIALSLLSTQAFAGGVWTPNGTSHNGIATFDAGDQDQTTNNIPRRDCPSKRTPLHRANLTAPPLTAATGSGPPPTGAHEGAATSPGRDPGAESQTRRRSERTARSPGYKRNGSPGRARALPAEGEIGRSWRRN